MPGPWRSLPPLGPRQSYSVRLLGGQTLAWHSESRRLVASLLVMRMPLPYWHPAPLTSSPLMTEHRPSGSFLLIDILGSLSESIA